MEVVLDGRLPPMKVTFIEFYVNELRRKGMHLVLVGRDKEEIPQRRPKRASLSRPFAPSAAVSRQRVTFRRLVTL